MRSSVVSSVCVSLFAVSLLFANESPSPKTADKELLEKLDSLQQATVERVKALRQFKGDAAKEAADIAGSMNAFCVHSMAPLMVLQNVEDSAKKLECGAFVHEYIARSYLKVFNYQPKRLSQLGEEANDPKLRKEISVLREQMANAEIEISLLISQIPRSQAPKFEFK